MAVDISRQTCGNKKPYYTPLKGGISLLKNSEISSPEFLKTRKTVRKNGV
jgi:hypothetical protein